MLVRKAVARLKAKIIAPMGWEPPRDERVEFSGEKAFLTQLVLAQERDCIVDVGAARGDWTAEALKIFPSTKFVLIEPIPLYAAHLRKRFGKNVTVHQCVLSDDAHDGVIHSVGVGGRLHNDPRHLARTQKTIEVVNVRFETGDQLLAGLLPYLIKIDCEGHDAKVIRGFKTIIETVHPIIQFEYCDLWLLANETLKETYKFLTERGYTLFRIFPDRLEPFYYRRIFETYTYQNFVAMPPQHRESL